MGLTSDAAEFTKGPSTKARGKLRFSCATSVASAYHLFHPSPLTVSGHLVLFLLPKCGSPSQESVSFCALSISRPSIRCWLLCLGPLFSIYPPSSRCNGTYLLIAVCSGPAWDSQILPGWSIFCKQAVLKPSYFSSSCARSALLL